MASFLAGSTITGAAAVTGYTIFQSGVRNSPGSSRDQRAAASRNAEFIYQNFACSWRNVREGRGWTLFTNAFLHGSPMHLLFNGIGLWTFSQTFVPLAGPRAFIPVFFGGVLAGNLTTLGLEARRLGAGVLDENGAGVQWRGVGRTGRSAEKDHIGMSGGVVAVSTALATIAPRMQFMLILPPVPVPAWLMTIGFAAFSVAADSQGWAESQDHLGHLGGMVSCDLDIEMRRVAC